MIGRGRTESGDVLTAAELQKVNPFDLNPPSVRQEMTSRAHGRKHGLLWNRSGLRCTGDSLWWRQRARSQHDASAAGKCDTTHRVFHGGTPPAYETPYNPPGVP